MCKDNLSFDKGMDRLDAIARKLETGNLNLEEALQYYEEGMKLSAVLHQKLADSRRKVEILRQGAGGEYVTEALEGDDDEIPI
jgi:exodeoxyribonuclease VII small subunit